MKLSKSLLALAAVFSMSTAMAENNIDVTGLVIDETCQIKVAGSDGMVVKMKTVRKDEVAPQILGASFSLVTPQQCGANVKLGFSAKSVNLAGTNLKNIETEGPSNVDVGIAKGTDTTMIAFSETLQDVGVADPTSGTPFSAYYVKSAAAVTPGKVKAQFIVDVMAP